jgi:hypothetical protein
MFGITFVFQMLFPGRIKTMEVIPPFHTYYTKLYLSTVTPINWFSVFLIQIPRIQSCSSMFGRQEIHFLVIYFVGHDSLIYKLARNASISFI